MPPIETPFYEMQLQRSLSLDEFVATFVDADGFFPCDLIRFMRNNSKEEWRFERIAGAVPPRYRAIKLNP